MRSVLNHQDDHHGHKTSVVLLSSVQFWWVQRLLVTWARNNLPKGRDFFLKSYFKQIFCFRHSVWVTSDGDGAVMRFNERVWILLMEVETAWPPVWHRWNNQSLIMQGDSTSPHTKRYRKPPGWDQDRNLETVINLGTNFGSRFLHV